MIRMTGCPNGCARPYMAELAFVGEGVTSYQLWVGGSPVLDGRTGWAYKSKVPSDAWENTVEPLLVYFKTNRLGPTEYFGDFCHRVGQEALETFAAGYTVRSGRLTPAPRRLAPRSPLRTNQNRATLPLRTTTYGPTTARAR